MNQQEMNLTFRSDIVCHGFVLFRACRISKRRINQLRKVRIDLVLGDF